MFGIANPEHADGLGFRHAHDHAIIGSQAVAWGLDAHLKRGPGARLQGHEHALGLSILQREITERDERAVEAYFELGLQRSAAPGMDLDEGVVAPAIERSRPHLEGRDSHIARLAQPHVQRGERDARGEPQAALRCLRSLRLGGLRLRVGRSAHQGLRRSRRVGDVPDGGGRAEGRQAGGQMKRVLGIAFHGPRVDFLERPQQFAAIEGGRHEDLRAAVIAHQHDADFGTQPGQSFTHDTLGER